MPSSKLSAKTDWIDEEILDSTILTSCDSGISCMQSGLRQLFANWCTDRSDPASAIIAEQSAGLTSGTRRCDNVTPILRNLHWLPITCRIDFRLCCLLYKAIRRMTPSYISDLLQHHTTKRSLRLSKWHVF